MSAGTAEPMSDREALALLRSLAHYFGAYPDVPAGELTCAELAQDLAGSMDDPRSTAEAEELRERVTA